MSRVSVECLTTCDAAAALADEWRDLAARAPGATPFQSPEWVLPWYHVWAAERVHVIAVRDRAAHLVALVPGVWMETRLELAGSGVGDYLAPLVADDAPVEALAALETACRTAPCFFGDLRDAVRWPDRADPEWRASSGSICPVAPLPASVEEWHAGLAPGLQRNLRRYGERIAREGARFSTVHRQEDLDGALDALFRLHGRRWAARSEPGIFGDAEARRFHRSSAPRLLASGALRLHLLAVGAQIVGAQYVLVQARRAYSYIGGFDPAWNRFSPGSLLMAYAIEQALAEGCTAFDFLRGTEPYKYMWGAVDHRTTHMMRDAGAGRSDSSIRAH